MVLTNMSFTSIVFCLFAFIVIICYCIAPKNKWIILLIASVLFYCSWGIEKLPFIVASALIAYLGAKKITERNDKCEEEIRIVQNDENGKNETRRLREEAKRGNKKVLFLAVALLLLMLFYVKAGKLIVDAFSPVGKVGIIVPLGISYYTFSLISYIADCYWKKDRAEENFFKLMLFAMYFPKILQGPISRHKTLVPQLVEDHKVTYESLTYGIQLMLWGYFKKLVIADRLAVFVNSVYGNHYGKSGSMLFVATIFGALQLYCDFSGCMDMACGFSEIIGIKLEKNFNHPFFSESAAEFWRRWHITLGAWFKDYVYMPVSIAPWMMKLMGKVRNRFGMGAAKNVSAIISLLVVWVLTGLWHGTGLNYVVWGIYWGLLIILGMLLNPLFVKLSSALNIKTDSYEWHLFRKVRTFFLFFISRVITIPGNLEVTADIFRRMLFEFRPWELVDGTVYTMGLDRPNFIAAVIFIGLLFLVSRYEEKNGSVRDWIAGRQVVLRWTLLYGLIFSIVIFGMYGPGYNAASFVYMNY